jgi:hypothetical protein
MTNEQIRTLKEWFRSGDPRHDPEPIDCLLRDLNKIIDKALDYRWDSATLIEELKYLVNEYAE